MTPQTLADIQAELGFSDVEFAAQLELTEAAWLSETLRGIRPISAAMAERAEQLLDDCRYARLILERKIQPQYEALVAEGSKPARLALVTALDVADQALWSTTRHEARLSIFKWVDRLARKYFEGENVEIVSRVEFISPPPPAPDEEPPHPLSVLGVRVEAA